MRNSRGFQGIDPSQLLSISQIVTKQETIDHRTSGNDRFYDRVKADLAKVFEKGTTFLSRFPVRTDSPRLSTMK